MKWLGPASIGDTTSVGAREILCAVQSVNLTHDPQPGRATAVPGSVQSRVPHLMGQNAVAKLI